MPAAIPQSDRLLACNKTMWNPLTCSTAQQADRSEHSMVQLSMNKSLCAENDFQQIRPRNDEDTAVRMGCLRGRPSHDMNIKTVEINTQSDYNKQKNENVQDHSVRLLLALGESCMRAISTCSASLSSSSASNSPTSMESRQRSVSILSIVAYIVSHLDVCPFNSLRSVRNSFLFVFDLTRTEVLVSECSVELVLHWLRSFLDP